jgi:hypothetical protein
VIHLELDEIAKRIGVSAEAVGIAATLEQLNVLQENLRTM